MLPLRTQPRGSLVLRSTVQSQCTATGVYVRPSPLRWVQPDGTPRIRTFISSTAAVDGRANAASFFTSRQPHPRHRRLNKMLTLQPQPIITSPQTSHALRRLYATPSRQAPAPVQQLKHYEAVVVGAGPAGITAVGNLLEQNVKPVLWVDDSFSGGRVGQYYREVPSNTKVKLFVDFAGATAPFREVLESSSSQTDNQAQQRSDDFLRPLRELDQEKGCSLGHAADMCVGLTQALRHAEGLEAHVGRVQGAVLDEGAPAAQRWTVTLNDKDVPSVTTKRLVLCTGAQPANPPLPVEIPGLQSLDLDIALSPTRLAENLADATGPATVGVIGASHSAVLVLMNLARLAQTSHPNLKIKWFTRHPLRYAEYNEQGQVIARDNTGLKGLAAVWARENLEPEALKSSPVRDILQRIDYQAGQEPKVYARHLPGAKLVVQAIGYQRGPLPVLTTADTGEEVKVEFDPLQGEFKFQGGKGAERKVPGLFGAGIAFPERVTDKKYGHVESNVGFFKFMNAVKKWVEVWRVA